jgi:hypothetical protein
MVFALPANGIRPASEWYSPCQRMVFTLPA